MNWFKRLTTWARSPFTSTGEPPARSRRFEAARINRLTSGWIADPLRINEDLRADLRTLVARSRDLSRNSPYIKRFIGQVKTNVLGPDGVKLRPAPLNRSGEIDEVNAKKVAVAWADWCRRGVCETTGRYSWIGFQNLVLETAIRDGEAFVGRVRRYKGNEYGYALYMIDASSIDYLRTQDLGGGRRVVMGVEFDAEDRVVAYWIKVPDQFGHRGAATKRISARDIRHIFLTDEIGQARGYPWATPVMLSMNMLDGYQEAHLVGARASAAKMGFYKQIDPSVEFAGDVEDGEFIEDAEAGHFSVIPAGYEFQTHDPNFPNDAYADFIKASLRGIASGLGVSYNSFANDLEGVNFSSMREGTREERETWKALQTWLIESLHGWVYEGWIENALMLGPLNLPLEQLKKFERVSWQPRRWSWVDPLKDIQANALAINTGIKTRADCIRELGGDPDEVWADLEKETKRLKASGVLPELSPAGASNSVEGEKDDEDD